MGSAGSPLCEQCREPGADIHTLLCPACLIALPPYYRTQAERFAIYAALLRQALVEIPVGQAPRWSEQQYHEYLRRSQSPPPPEPKKASKPPSAKAKNPRTLTFSLPLVPMRNGYDRMHWNARRALLKELGATLAQQIPLGSGTPFAHAKVEIVRYSSSEPDQDGLVGSVKPILDAMQVPRVDKGKRGERKLHPYGAYIIENDNPDCIDLSVRWERCSPKHGKCVVFVTPIP